MRGKIVELMVRIRNLNDLLQHTIRIGETDMSRKVRESIRDRERELRILKVQNELNQHYTNKGIEEVQQKECKIC
jgi:hypothetical protein